MTRLALERRAPVEAELWAGDSDATVLTQLVRGPSRAPPSCTEAPGRSAALAKLRSPFALQPGGVKMGRGASCRGWGAAQQRRLGGCLASAAAP